MKKLLVLFLLLGPQFVSAQNITTLRDAFITASESQGNSENFLKVTSPIKSNAHPQLLAYKGAALIISSKFTPKIEDKKKNAKEGIGLLETAVSKDADNLEIRAIRMGIQEHSPKILKYKASIPSDKNYLLENFKKITNKATINFINGFISKSSLFTHEEKMALK